MTPPTDAHGARDVEPAAPPVAGEACGPSFPLLVKLLASVLMLLLAGAVGRALTAPQHVPPGALGAGEWAFLVAVAAVIVSGYWGILTSRTSCGPERIAQTWLWRKKVDIAAITQVKLIHVRGLAWLIVPRLIVRTGDGLTTFQTADRAVLRRFEQLAHGR